MFTLHAGLYVSKDYLEEFGTPKEICDLDEHRLLTRSRAHENPYSDINWLLKIGREGKEPRTLFYTSNSVESLFRAAKQGMGITIGYKEMDNVRESGLIEVLPDVKKPSYKEHLVSPKNTEQVKRIKVFRNYLKEQLANQ